jgi:hypothetical protein
LRCYTLFQESYDCCRRAASYLRWEHGDADSYVPTLYPRGGRRRPKRPHVVRGEEEAAETGVDATLSGLGDGAGPLDG